MMMHFTDENFQKEAIEASKTKPVLVDFFAEWCGPCRMQGPIVEELAGELGDKAVVGKLNTEEARGVASQFNVMSIPTLLIFKDGKVASQMVGLRHKDELVEELKKHM